jgi:choline dehydrogenase-like flavoprotein
MIDTSNKEIQSHYDYIVVGTGAAGSVLAAELSASGAQVLVIESGGPDDAPTIMNPSIWFYNVGGPLDYHLPVNPSPRLNNRKFNMALGHVLGGGTSINAMVWMRGMQRDYDGWAENGAKGWAFADVLPVFKTQEDWEGGVPEVTRAAADMARQAIVVKVDTEHYPELTARFNVRGIPNFVIFSAGRPVMQQAGAVNPEQIENWLRSAQSSSAPHARPVPSFSGF